MVDISDPRGAHRLLRSTIAGAWDKTGRASSYRIVH